MGFHEWWRATGSGVVVDRRDDHEEHAKKVAAKAWDAALEDSTGLSASDMPPVPSQLLWMFDGIDRKEATKMMHDYAMAAIAQRLLKEKIPHGLVRALQTQVQVDADGALVGVSRQALAELFDWNDAPYSTETPNAKFSGDEKRSFSDSAGTPG